MTPAAILLSLVTFERLAELWLARRNTANLLAKGGQEVAAAHYPAIVMLHALWLSGLWLLAAARPVSLPWLGIFLILQLLRGWVLLTLGDRWTTRIIVLPGAPLVSHGVYRAMRHPNYVGVAGEVLGSALWMRAPITGTLFVVTFGLILFQRIRIEERALGLVPRA